MTRALFICGKARQRSPTAVYVARNWSHLEADFAGLSADADEPVSSEHLAWADVIFVMETRQKKRLSTKLGAPSPGKRIISLDIPDRYKAMDPTLVEILTQKLTYHFGPPASPKS